MRFAWLLATPALLAQQPIQIHVDVAKKLGPLSPIYRYFGYDEPNYTYSPHGKKLIGELAALSSKPVYIRTHFLLATGDGTPGLKWGSTNAYTEDAAGNPVYDWSITDRIFDTYLSAGAKPFVEIGFMPKALSSKPEPYQPTWIPGDRNPNYSIGWTYPPADYGKWGELVYQWVSHAAQKYGRDEAASWYWEIWNEPDISYWHGTPEEYDKLYDYAAAAVKRALPTAKVGGPATTGPSSAKAAGFLRQFLDHCAHGTNAASGKTGVPLDFISYHAKGQPTVVDGHVRMGIAKNAKDADEGFRIVASFPEFRRLPIVLTESDPEGCAACSARVYPQNAYRNGPLYASYTAAMLKNLLELGAAAKINLEGMLTWAFEFENQPYFDGFRTLATNGLDKPVLNLFRMAGLMRGDRVQTTSSASLTPQNLIASGVRSQPYIDALGAGSPGEVSVLVWHYHDDDTPAPASAVSLLIENLPPQANRVRIHHYRIDADHSNAWTAWKNAASPQHPTPDQYKALEAAGQLQLLTSPYWLSAHSGSLEIPFDIPRQGVSLIQLTW